MTKFPKGFDNYLSCKTFALSEPNARDNALFLARRYSNIHNLQPADDGMMVWWRPISLITEGETTATLENAPNILVPLGKLQQAEVFGFISAASVIASSFKNAASVYLKPVTIFNMTLDMESYARDVWKQTAIRLTQISITAADRQVIAFETFSLRLAGTETDPVRTAASARAAFDIFQKYLAIA